MKKRFLFVVICLFMVVTGPLANVAAAADQDAAAFCQPVSAEEVAADVFQEEAETKLAAGTEGLNVTGRTVSEIRAFAFSHPAELFQRVTYKTKPSLSGTYSAGILSDTTLKSALNLLNQCRYIAGLDGNVTLDENYSKKASAATLVNRLNGELSHMPSIPSVLHNPDLYNLGVQGASSSNLASGYYNLNQAILYGWLSDSDSYNIDRVGHRRWVLNPDMGKVGFGATDNYYAMYVFDRSGTGGQSRVAWPAQNMPIQYFDAGDAWSVSFGKSLTASKIKVTLVRTSDNKKWTFSSTSSNGNFYVNNSGYGQAGCVIFRPDSLTSIKAGDSFTVTISGAESSPVSYQVNFFDMVRSISSASVTLSSKEYTYDGKAKKPSTVVKLGNTTLKKGTDYTVTYQNNVNVGTGKVIITGIGNYKGTVTKTFAINKADQTINVSLSSSSVKVGTTVTIKAAACGAARITYSSSNTSVAKVSSTGTVTGTGVGTVTITIKAAATGNYHQALKKLQIRVIPRTPSIAGLTSVSSGVTVKWNRISEADGYYVYRKKGSETGWTEAANIKNGTVLSWTDKHATENGTKYVYMVKAYKTVSGTAYTSTSSSSKTIYRLSRPTISGLTNSASKTFKVTWGKNTKASGYQVQYATASSFSGAKTKTYSGYSSVTKSVNGLTKGKTYYVRVRSYKTVGNVKYYSAWSTAKKVKITR
ncbi:MAG: hypothetical protein MR966_09715 [Lachnospiraceae bacterium]|nr:hypothetical protein [Lachnospiraceae bacterium]